MAGATANVIVPPSATTSARRRPRVGTLVLLVVLGCIVVRGAVALTVYEADPHVATQADSPTYLEPALALLDHGRFSESANDRQPEFLRTPGYPAFIALVYLVAGHHVVALLLAQVLLGAATVLVLFALGRRMGSDAVGLLAAALLVFEPLQLYTTGSVLTESLATLLLALVALFGFIVFAAPAPTRRVAFLLGLALAVATLVRPVMYYLPLVVVAFVASTVVRRRTTWRDACRVLAALLVPLVVLVGGWQLRNHEAVGSWRVSGIEGKNLYLFRAAEIVAAREHTHLAVAQARLLAELGPLGSTRQGPYYERMYRRGLAIVEGHPLLAVEDALGGLVDEVTSARSRFFAYIGLRDPPPLLGDLATLLLVALYAFAVVGVVAVVRARRDLLGHAFVLAVAVYVLVASAGPEAFAGRGERFRAVIMPIVVLYAARGIVDVVARRRSLGLTEDDARTSLPTRSG